MTALVLTALFALAGPSQPPAAAGSPHIVFVCEHGDAKSLIASAYFNKLAAERSLAVRAVFRAVDALGALSVRAVAGLKEDGLAIPNERPTAIAATDVAVATHMFTIGCALPQTLAASGKVQS